MFTAIEASKIAEQLYGLSGTVTRLAGEYDLNFHIKTQNGEEFLLKISHPNEDKSILDMQNAVLARLQATSRPFNAPTLHKTLSGDYIGQTTHHDNAPVLVRLFTFVPGKLLADKLYHSPALLESLGTQLGHLTLALRDFQHAAAKRYLEWDLKQAPSILAQLALLENKEDQACVAYFLQRYVSHVEPVLSKLRHSVIHGDSNDYNVLVSSTALGQDSVSGFIDFGDLVETATICELAIAATYAMLNKPDPLQAGAQVVKGYHAIFPLMENELNVLYDLIAIRLCMSVMHAAIRTKDNPDDAYLSISEKPAWALLRQLRTIHPRLALYTFRAACDLEACPQTTPIVKWLQAHANEIASLLQPDLLTQSKFFLDLSPGSLQADHFIETQAQVRQAGATLAIGQYNEARLVYSGEQFQVPGNDGDEARTIHIGMDLFMPSGTPIYAPLDGVVHSIGYNNQPQDYGPTLLLEHRIPEENLSFYTLYGHLSKQSLAHLTAGQAVAKGSLIASIGATSENGGWIPHLHFQVVTDLLDNKGQFPGVAQASKKAIWLSLSPDPNLITRIPLAEFPPGKWQKSAIQQTRRQCVGKSIGLAYDHPLEIVRGIGQYLFDENARRYLDCVNNVCHVGHCHPKVVAAGQRQMALINSNTRYLHENLAHYAKRLAATLPSPLEVCFFVCSGSEANELALRLAQTHTGLSDYLVMDHAYHGNTSTLINISPYKFNGPGGKGKPHGTHVLPLPGADKAQWKFPAMEGNIAAFICESIISCGGQIVLPDQYLQHVYALVRQAGGVCIADEVQVGLGRVGTHFWGFETQGVVPDIVTMGKPLGNGHPMAAVVTTKAIADSFCNGMEYFNTFGGNPVSCAIGLSVLDVLEEEQLQAHALKMGHYLKQKLNQLKDKHEVIADIRGLGLFLGIELVNDRKSLAPATALAAFVVNRMKERGILLSTDGPHKNVIKIKPPLVFTQENSDHLAANLDYVLSTAV